MKVIRDAKDRTIVRLTRDELLEIIARDLGRDGKVMVEDCKRRFIIGEYDEVVPERLEAVFTRG